VTANGNAGGGGLGNFGLCIYGSGVNESMYFTTQSHLQLEKCCSDAEKVSSRVKWVSKFLKNNLDF
jgi:hypothetical protein